MFTVKLFKPSSNQYNSETIITYSKCSSWHRLDERNIQFTDADSKVHFSNMIYEVIEEK